MPVVDRALHFRLDGGCSVGLDPTTGVPNRSTATKKAYCPKRIYRRRHKIENYFCRIKDWRRLATRFDKLARNFLAAAALVGALYWIKL